MNIDDLNQSISEMTEDELKNLLREMRSSRRKVQEKPAKKTTSSKPKKSSKDALAEAVSSMTDEQKEKLLKELMG